jgi:hypothetical protein
MKGVCRISNIRWALGVGRRSAWNAHRSKVMHHFDQHGTGLIHESELEGRFSCQALQEIFGAAPG